MIRSANALRALTLIGASAVLLTACASSSGTGNTSTGKAAPASATPSTHVDAAKSCAPDKSTSAMKIGTMLPQTGSLAYLAPPAEAGSGLAIDDINAAGGVLGKDVKVTKVTDSGDSSDMTVSSNSASQIVSSGVSMVLAPESSSVTLNVVDQLSAACIVSVSAANTASDLSGYSSYYFRTAPPDSVQGSALGQLITGDGNSKVSFLVFNDSYGTGLRNYTEKAIEDAGGSVVYGAEGKSQEFAPGSTSFSSDVSAAIGADPDAIVILAFDETKSIVPELVSQGWDMSKVYMSDGNTADYSGDFDKGTLTDAQGTIPGAAAPTAFKKRLVSYYASANNKKKLSDFSYAPEAYDAITLSALAAQAGGGTDSGTIQANMAAVSGADGGTKCSTYADCLKLLKADKSIHYTGQSGIGPFNSDNDPSSAYIGIYKFDEKNTPVFQTSVQGNVTQ